MGLGFGASVEGLWIVDGGGLKVSIRGPAK